MRNILTFSIIAIISLCGCLRRDSDGFLYSRVELRLRDSLVSNTINDLEIRKLSSNEIFTLEKVLKGKGEKLIFFFSDFHCVSCIIQEVSLLIKNKSSLEFVLLANFRSVRELRILLNQNNMENVLVVISSLPQELESLSDPIYLSFDKESILKNVMIPILGDTLRSMKFFNYVSK